MTVVHFYPPPVGGALGFSSDVFIMDAVGGGDMNLGELADLTVANDNDLSMDVIKHQFLSIHCGFIRHGETLQKHWCVLICLSI